MSSKDVHEFDSRLADVASGQAPVIALSKSRGRLGAVALFAAIALVHVIGFGSLLLVVAPHHYRAGAQIVGVGLGIRRLRSGCGMPLTLRPEGTEGWDEDQLAEIFTLDCMIGIGLPNPGVTTNVIADTRAAVHPLHE